MEKQKRWQFYLILAVIALTMYNILPTLFFYSKPLSSPVDAPRAQEVAHQIVARVDSLEDDSKAWIGSFSHLIGVNPTSIDLKESDPGLVLVTFSNEKEAEKFQRFLPRAGALIPFVPAQLELYPTTAGLDKNTVAVARQIAVHLNPNEADDLFHFSAKLDQEGNITPLYRDLAYDRATQLALGFAGTSKLSTQLSAIAENPADAQYDEVVLDVAKTLVEADKALGKSTPLAKRYYANAVQGGQGSGLIQKYLARAETLKASLAAERETLLQEQKKLRENGEFLSNEKEQTLSAIEGQRQKLDAAITIVQKNQALFKEGPGLTQASIQQALKLSESQLNAKEKRQVVNLEGRNPFVEALVLNWGDNRIELQFYPEVAASRQGNDTSEVAAFTKEKINQMVIQDIARASQLSDESILPYEGGFATNLNTLINSQSVLTFDLGYLANKLTQQIANQLQTTWLPKEADLARDAYPIVTYDAYKNLTPEEKKLGLVVYAPAMYDETAPLGFRTGSVYVIARGLDSIMQKYKQNPDAPESKDMLAAVNQLNTILQQKGFIGYPGSSYGIDPEYRKDYIFELNDYYSVLLKATREDFVVKGSKRYATLDFTDVEQLILTRNKIDDRIQEDLLKWKEEYSTAQVDSQTMNRYVVPAPTKNVYWENLKLTMAKYFRGDDRKVLKWGLDLSGGKTVRIGLRDHNGRPVTNPEDLKQAVNELYTRINNMGVSERTIHIENNNIILDFPGSQNLSAAELIKASAMYFHIVNEKFTPHNPALRHSVNEFLQNVWNEAVVTNRKDIESINQIAWQQLGGDSSEPIQARPIGSVAKDLLENGLRLANPNDRNASHEFNDTLSAVAMLRGEDYADWEGQAHPLLIMFHNYALEGANLNNIQVGYDPSQGNLLSFGVKRSYEKSQGGSPRDEFYSWTAQFAEDKIGGTAKESYSQGQGWRMAVVLNDRIISSPVLRAALRDGGQISGRFSQREVSQLAADLKAGSLSFTPQILSEENVSPELGREERVQGIVASLVALALVVIAMISYYHFAGIVASCAVIFNILIMWAGLQNLNAALTLPGIAGIVLTIGMAVDANVLVFERIREEFKISGRIASAIQAGYRKAFSAIIDSNITTIIAALILIQFDSGPIKGFAVTLIIGILSSMFTALFMTRYFFAGWVQNPKNKTLTMSQFIQETNIDFLGKAKAAIMISLVVMLLGTYFFIDQRKTLFGMDFTGGYSLNTELVEKPGTESYRIAVANALLAHGATTNDFQIRELSKPNQLRIQLSTGMEEKGHPFYQMPELLSDGQFAYEYQHNPRLVWLVNTLADEGLQIVPSHMATLDSSWTVISGQLSDTMRNNALIALGIALLSILTYITFRFEFKYALAACIALVHDVVITLGVLAFFHWLGFGVQIDLQVIGAIMTILGYSLNDTIIVFDRIREDLHIMRKMPYRDIINHALNVTLSRTIMTSGTTLLVLITLVLLGGKSIFAFSLVMTIGVLVGTASSLFIATPALLYLHNREEREQALQRQR
ncbi:MAG: protein translocase subunit SecD [Parachlamydiaceae bacterium]|nr:protein translocase subunit SecD [Parachlamydiaceae bacterium]